MIDLIFLLAIVLSFCYQNSKRALFFVFLAGFIYDLFFGFGVGRTSLVLLAIGFLAILYTKKFSYRHFIFQLFYIFLSFFAFSYLLGRPWYWQKGFGLTILGLIIFVFLNKRRAKTSLGMEV